MCDNSLAIKISNILLLLKISSTLYFYKNSACTDFSFSICKKNLFLSISVNLITNLPKFLAEEPKYTQIRALRSKFN